MGWISIVAAILSILGPVLRYLLERWLRKAAVSMDADAAAALDGDESRVTPARMAALFDRALADMPRSTWYWPSPKAAILRALMEQAKRVAVARCGEIARAVKTNAPPSPMTGTEAGLFAAELEP